VNDAQQQQLFEQEKICQPIKEKATLNWKLLSRDSCFLD
jgi:hypothetical protein